jgi:F-box and WD-40 domain protein 1/11
MLRTRPRTAAAGEFPDTTATWTAPGPWVANHTASNTSHLSSLAQQFEAQSIAHQSNREQDHYNGQVLEEITAFPDASPRRRAAKSFSSLRHSVDGLRALGRRLSVTIRRKSSKHNLQVPHQEDRRDDDSPKYQSIGATVEERPGHVWFRGPSINRRPSLHSVSALQTFYAPTGHLANSIPCMGFEPPVFSDDLPGGAAARAAAAAQNEMAKADRVSSRGDSKIFDRVERDSESGIGIDLRDRADGSELELAVVRLGTFSPISDTPGL